ncbi:MAG: DUF5606 domain-containing protein [Bacteroidales bacterium]
MDLSKILSISGKPGLYLLVSQTKTGALVESLLDGKRQPAFSNERISSLEDISIFTLEEDIPLKKVFELIYSKENGGGCISHKSDNNKIVQYMEEILPDFDRDRVYVSDMKKLFSWYNILNAKGLITIEEVKEETI